MKATTTQFMQFDIRQWHREGLLAITGEPLCVKLPFLGTAVPIDVSAKADCVVVSIRWNTLIQPSQVENMAIRLQWTSCHFGGVRPWFMCPQPECHRKVAILYVCDGVCCRQCANLAYATQFEQPEHAAYRRIQKVRAQLGWGTGLSSRTPAKPRGMHRKTFHRLVEQFHACEVAWFEICAQWLRLESKRSPT